MLRIARYGNSRFWTLYDGQELVAVTVYKRGAQEVRRRLEARPPAGSEAASPRPAGAPRRLRLGAAEWRQIA